MSTDTDFDFGFSIVDEDELPVVQTLQAASADALAGASQTAETAQQLQDQMQELYNSILPLLKNLKANPEKEYILWPNRTAKIDAFKKKIDSIVGKSVATKPI
jgi:aspartate-semialdehyde dehydrogenase